MKDIDVVKLNCYGKYVCRVCDVLILKNKANLYNIKAWPAGSFPRISCSPCHHQS